MATEQSEIRIAKSSDIHNGSRDGYTGSYLLSTGLEWFQLWIIPSLDCDQSVAKYPDALFLYAMDGFFG
jgi:hypothetical protein